MPTTRPSNRLEGGGSARKFEVRVPHALFYRIEQRCHLTGTSINRYLVEAAKMRLDEEKPGSPFQRLITRIGL